MIEGSAMTERLERPLSPRFREAVDYALEHHREHARKGGQIPYASHLLAVASIVLDMQVSEDEAITALLHDVVEDEGGEEAEAEIRRRFGDDVADWVHANSDSTTGASEKAPWRDRKEAYLAGIATKPIEAVRVSIADKLHNARAIVSDRRVHGDSLWDRFDAASDPAWYYGRLVEEFEGRRGELGPGGEVALDELRAEVQELSRIAPHRPS